MFDFAWSHFALLFIIAIILLGPKEIPTVLRFVGRWMGKIRQHKAEFQEYFDAITVDTPLTESSHSTAQSSPPPSTHSPASGDK